MACLTFVGGHLGFCPLAELAQNFARCIQAYFVQHPQFIKKQPSNLDQGDLVTGPIVCSSTINLTNDYYWWAKIGDFVFHFPYFRPPKKF